MEIRCLKCKGRGFCGRKVCPHVMKLNSMANARKRHTKTEFSSQSPAPFIGRFGYPEVNVGVLSPPENSKDTWKYDSPKYWSKTNYDIPRLVNIRADLLNSKFKSSVKGNISQVQEVGLAQRPVDMDFFLQDKPRFRMQSNSVTAPTGPDAHLQKADITSNPKIGRKVDKVYSDTEMKAADAINYLYKSGYDESFVSKIMSVGGIGKDRKLVPTRWSITAADDTVGKNLIEEVSLYKQINEHTAYFGEYLGNYYLIMLLPGLWGYELFETYVAKNFAGSPEYTTDYENHTGRKHYAYNCAGGYYSVRLAILEKLREMKRRATCVVVRVITGDYSVPLGVWVTREASRKALANNPLRFSSKELMLNYARLILNKKFGIRKEEIIKDSKLLKVKQNTLDKFC